MSKAIQKKPGTLVEKIESMAPEFKRALGEIITPDRFIGAALLQLRKNKALQQCNPESIMGALYTTAQLALEPVAGQTYLVPYKDECQLIIGYFGMVQLFHRSPKAGKITWGIVCEGDTFDFEYGTNQFLRHKPAEKQNFQKPLSYWVLARLKNGEENFLVWDRDHCMAHGKKFSKSFASKWSPWQTAPDVMCLKTVLKQLAKTLPISFDFQKAVAADEKTRHYLPGIEDFEDMPPLDENDEKTIDLPDLSKLKEKAKNPDTGTNHQRRPPQTDELAALQAALQLKAVKAWGAENISVKLKEILPGTGIEEIQMISNFDDMVKVERALAPNIEHGF